MHFTLSACKLMSRIRSTSKTEGAFRCWPSFLGSYGLRQWDQENRKKKTRQSTKRFSLKTPSDCDGYIELAKVLLRASGKFELIAHIHIRVPLRISFRLFQPIEVLPRYTVSYLHGETTLSRKSATLTHERVDIAVLYKTGSGCSKGKKGNSWTRLNSTSPQISEIRFQSSKNAEKVYENALQLKHHGETSEDVS